MLNELFFDRLSQHPLPIPINRTLLWEILQHTFGISIKRIGYFVEEKKGTGYI